MKQENAIAKNMIWAIIALGINYLTNFLVTPYISNNIGIEAYGYVGLTNTVTSYIDIIAIGLNSFAGRYISVSFHRGDFEKSREYYTSTIIANIILSIAILIPVSITVIYLDRLINIPDQLTRDVKILFLFVIFNYILTILRTADNSAMFIINRLDLFEQRQGMTYFIKAGLLLLLCFFLAPHVWYVGLATTVSSAYFLFAAIKLRKKYVKELYPARKYWNPKAIIDIISNGIWLSLNNLGNTLNSGLDLLITELMLTPTILGQVSVAKSLSVPGYAIVMKISNSFQPKLAQLYVQKDLKEQVRLYKKAMEITGSFYLILFTTFVACGKDFLSLWLPGQNIHYIFVLCCIALGSEITPAITHPLHYIYNICKKIKFPCFMALGRGALNVIFMYILIKYFNMGGYAVVLTTFILSLVHLFDTPIYAAICLKIDWKTFYPIIFRCGAALLTGTFTTLFIAHFIPVATSWYFMILKAGVLGVFSCIAVTIPTGVFRQVKDFIAQKVYWEGEF